MKYNQLIIGLLLGAGAYYLWTRRNKKKSTEVIAEAVAEVKQEEEKKYSAPLKKKYDIVMPSDLVAKKVKQKAKDLTKRRYEVNLNKVQEPVSI
jgi:hypothetical protein